MHNKRKQSDLSTPGILRKINSRRQRNKKLFLIIVACMVVCLAWGFLKKAAASPGPLTGLSKTAGSAAETPPESTFDWTGVYSRNAILVERKTGRVLAQKNAGQKIYPASLTKIMTAVLTLEHTNELSDFTTVPPGIFERLYAEEASMAGFLPGEKVRYIDLLYGMLLPSGAECCLTCAVKISGSEAGFAEKMNQKAGMLGMKNTHFTNATGLHDPNHYSTVEDVAALLGFALNDSAFRTAFTSSVYNVPPSEKHPGGFTFHSTMFQNLENPEVTGGEILGGKTGFTDEAGLCLASLAVVNGQEYILVTANAHGNHQSEQRHIQDAIRIYNRLGENGDLK